DFHQHLTQLVLGENGAEAPLLYHRSRRRRNRRERRVLHFLQPGLEAEALVLRALARRIALARITPVGELLERDREGYITLYREKLARLGQPVFHLAQVLAGKAADFIGMGDYAFERAVLHDPFAGGLRPDLVHAGNVVDLVADQRQIVDDLLRRHAELGLHARDVELFVRHRIDPQRARIDELGEVLVAGRDDRAPALRPRLLDQRGDDVVRLDPVDQEQRPAERADGVVQRLDLARQVVGHRGAGRL